MPIRFGCGRSSPTSSTTPSSTEGPGFREPVWRLRCLPSARWGDGVPDGDSASVFEPYSRLVDDATMSRPGIGLGLSIVHDLVGRHGGSVEVVHDGGLHGFEFTLPTVKSEALTPGVGVGASRSR